MNKTFIKDTRNSTHEVREKSDSLRTQTEVKDQNLDLTKILLAKQRLNSGALH